MNPFEKLRNGMKEALQYAHLERIMTEQLAVAINALSEIAAYDDSRASDRLAKTGSYGSFDEPGSVEIARDALKRILEKLPEHNE